MSVETLRRAAALMRERAEGARGGCWFAEGDEVRANWTLVRQVATCHGSIDIGNSANAEHIASWHPAVALAVAVMLEDAVARYEADQRSYADERACGRYPYWTPTLNHAALAVARAYLGDDAC